MSAILRILSATIAIISLGGIIYIGGNKLTTGEFLATQDNKTVIAKIKKAPQKPKTIAVKTDPMENFVPNIAKGKKLSGKCKACHTFAQNKPNKTGPNLWAIVNRMTASNADFNYSAAMKEKSSMPWSEENLDKYLTKPRKFIPGNKMAFGGIRKATDRANLIAWLKTLK